jgi:hypothetical protein
MTRREPGGPESVVFEITRAVFAAQFSRGAA